jgi:hypothetical protein
LKVDSQFTAVDRVFRRAVYHLISRDNRNRGRNPNFGDSYACCIHYQPYSQGSRPLCWGECAVILRQLIAELLSAVFGKPGGYGLQLDRHVAAEAARRTLIPKKSTTKKSPADIGRAF